MKGKKDLPSNTHLSKDRRKTEKERAQAAQKLGNRGDGSSLKILVKREGGSPVESDKSERENESGNSRR